MASNPPGAPAASFDEKGFLFPGACAYFEADGFRFQALVVSRKHWLLAAFCHVAFSFDRGLYSCARARRAL